MAKKKEENPEVIVDVQQVYNKTENFVEQNKMTISVVLGGIVLVIAAFAFYFKVYLPPIESEAQENMFWAEKYFEQDSLNLAINGDNIHAGFIEIIENYSGTNAANLAHYYLGISYRNIGKFEDAIDELNEFSSDDVMLSAIALGAIGDCYSELNDIDNAINYYKKAAEKNKNNVTSPVYLFKAGVALEANKEFEKAAELYKKIKKEYASSNEGRNIDKYIARAEAMKN
ncbi:MAG: tetratricopeptide repeat protein [Vicingaceae bacterium]|nr:tetratricopeptide repeat protein [Vicingaceae bacterium]